MSFTVKRLVVLAATSWVAAALPLAAHAQSDAQPVPLPATAPATLGGPNSIERIDATQTGAGVYLTIQLKEPVAAVPPSFSIENPPRIALDLPQTSNNLGRSAIEINQGDLRSVNVVQAQGRARIVLNLRRSGNYTVNVEGTTVRVAIGVNNDSTTFRAQEPAPAAAATAAAPAASPATAQAAPLAAAAGGKTIRGIDFRRGTDGAGRIVVDLSDPNTSVDIRQQGTNVVVDFLGASLPDPLRRRLDVTDFGTPVAQVNTYPQGGNTHMVIEPKGLWEQNAYQSDNRFVIEIKPIKEDPTRLFQGGHQGYQGERLSLNFQNVDVRALLQVIADFTNLNIITSDSVGGSITLRLKDVPWDQALDIILQSKGLDMRKNGNVVWIAPRDLEARSQIADLEPLRTESFTVNYQKADDVRALLSSDKQRLLSKRGSAVVDVRTNQLFVQDTASKLDEVRHLLAQIDIPVPQVMIEARIVQANDQFSRDIGARFGVARISSHYWLNSGANSYLGPSTGGSIPTANTNNPNITINNTTFGSPNFVNLPAAGLNGFQPGSLGLTLFNSTLSGLLNLEVSALELDGKGKVVSSPRVITADKVKASIEQGTEIPYQSASAGSGIGTVQFRKAVLRLEVTPQITPEGSIFLDVKVNKDTPNSSISTGAGVAIDTNAVVTQVLVENGGTIVLGGIYQDTLTDTTTKIPFLGDIPVLGNLFKDHAVSNQRTELLIFITPRVVSERVTTAGR
jgi:type IV pilus assembly protein PilQ